MNKAPRPVNEPLTRQALQEVTRERLVFAARAIFARDGFHGASLDGIAKEAGYSKGAVYSNFASKADLFLAVMDLNIEAAADASVNVGQTWDSYLANNAEFNEAIRGFALATLEFIATAGRDERLNRECGKRLRTLVEGYAQMATDQGVTGSGIPLLQVGALLAALDQGSAVLSIAGEDSLTDAALQRGIEALIDAGKSSEPLSESTAPAFHMREVRRRIGAHLSDDAE